MDRSDSPAAPARDDRCPQCGHEVGDAWLVCAWCGQQLAAAAELAEGSRLGDSRYQILRVIGRGGFGITYDVGDRRLQRRVAMKELFPESAVRHGSLVLTPPQGRAGFKAARERFLREARVLARFTHPGIVRVYEVFEEHGTAYLVMELLEGRTLIELLQQRGRAFPEDEVLDVAGRVAAALRPVHAAGVLHRDINPSNVMMTHHGRIVVIDFGLARDYDQDHTVGMTRVVTPGYAPLEQYRGEGRFGPSTDVYGLAATCYRLATGKVPISAMDRDGGAALPSPHSLNPAISKPVSDAILDGLELEPTHRPQDLDAFLSRLGIRRLPEGPRSILLDTVPPPPVAPSAPGSHAVPAAEGPSSDRAAAGTGADAGTVIDPGLAVAGALAAAAVGAGPATAAPPAGGTDPAWSPPGPAGRPAAIEPEEWRPSDPVPAEPVPAEPVSGATEVVARRAPGAAASVGVAAAGALAASARLGAPAPGPDRGDHTVAGPWTDPDATRGPDQPATVAPGAWADADATRGPGGGDGTRTAVAGLPDDPRAGLAARTAVAPQASRPALPPPPAPVRRADDRPHVVGPHRPGRRKLVLPLFLVALATGSAAPVLVTALVVFVALPALATLGDSVAHRLRAEHGVASGWAERRLAPGALAPARFVRNVVASTLRATPMIGIGAVLLAGWYALDRLDVPQPVLDLGLRGIGLLVVGITVVTQRDGSARFRTGLGLDELVGRLVPGGRTTERLVVLWLVAALVIAGSLWLSPDPFPLP